MSTAVVVVHLTVEPGEPQLTEASRVSREGRADLWLHGEDRVRGHWDHVGAGDTAVGVARRHGLDPVTENPYAREIDAAYADERDDPRWIVTFEIEEP
ncbi:hypothetical protein ACT17_06345 [Mycolicibacterium conceptionense]|uniref:Uncharacterized protein n=1 Tax=Mycolicibacterium conceptionense TaxID=451644 RepID=A0A0J8UFH0_9MYCO|nr:hypothetical protein [Mycolicibacterium conceptionense]KMV19652.1 hypothetical protein ACT17_06345 [Mycolicibacterium conceptionense]